jgi:hypothetical protein
MSFLDRFRRLRPVETEVDISGRDVLTPPDGFTTGVESYCWRVLVQSYVRVLARQQGRDWLTIPDREIHAMLEPYHRDLDRDVRALGVAIEQARSEGMSRMQSAIHHAPGLDHEMVDEAIHYALKRTDKPR